MLALSQPSQQCYRNQKFLVIFLTPGTEPGLILKLKFQNPFRLQSWGESSAESPSGFWVRRSFDFNALLVITVIWRRIMFTDERSHASTPRARINLRKDSCDETIFNSINHVTWWAMLINDVSTILTDFSENVLFEKQQKKARVAIPRILISSR